MGDDIFFLELSKMAETHILRGILIEWVQQKKHNKFVDDLKLKLSTTQGIIS